MPFPARSKDPLTIAAAATVAIALFALASWGLNIWHMQLLSAAHVPMAPSTALLFLLLGSCMLAARLQPAFIHTWHIPALAGFIAIVGLLAITRKLSGIESDILFLLSPASLRSGAIPLGIMSPLTAFSFLCCALALFTGFPPDSHPHGRRQLSALCSLLVMLISLTVFLSYAAGAPVLYGSSTVPMALITAICFQLTGVVLLAGAGNDTWPLSLFHTETTDASGSSSGRLFTQEPLLIFLLLSLVIAIMGVFYLKRQFAESRRVTQADLELIARLKSGQISTWYRERLLDAEHIFRNPLIQQQTVSYFTGTSAPSIRKGLQTWLNELIRLGYTQAILYDRQGTPRLWADTIDRPEKTVHPDFQRAITAKTITITDLHREQQPDGSIFINLWIPFTDSGSTAAADGVLLLKRSPGQFLYPLIQTWPTNSRTAETLIVRREGNDVLFLNSLRHRQGAELALRLPLAADSSLPAARAVTGGTGVMEGLDYRNEPVLAAICRIPETPWFMVSKIDLVEVLEPVRKQAWITGGVLLVLLLSTALWISLQWQRRNNLWLRRQLAAEQAKTRAEEELNRLNVELEKRVRQRTAQLNAANKELEAFSYSVSHDLRAPLRHLSGFVELLNKHAHQSLDAKTRHYLEVISTSATQMSTLVDDLLSFSRMGRVEMLHEQVKMGQLVEELLEKLEPETRNRTIQWHIHPLPDVEGDPAMLRLVLMNLLSNAIKYTGKTPSAEIEIGCRDDNPEELVFFVRDNGAGFDMRYADKLFHLFQRLHSSDEFEGNGVGLANIHRIILRHGGRVWAEGAVNQGAIFCFSLPMARQTPEKTGTEET